MRRSRGNGTAGVLAVCEDLVAGRPPRAPTAEEAALLSDALNLHGLSGLAAAAIGDGGLEVPAEVGANIDRDRSEMRRRSAVLDLECERIGRVVLGGDAGLSPPILLKGPAVAGRYRDPSLRGYADIDLLVPEEELGAWRRVLLSLGYGPPGPWQHRDARRYRHALAHERPLAGGRIMCDLHHRLIVERRARGFGYRILFPETEPSRFSGLRQPTSSAQLVVLALHLVHHQRSSRRLIWLRDFIELGDVATVRRARGLAERHGVRWALERALLEAERILRRRAWEASPPRERFGVARIQELWRPGHLYHLALMRELGLRDGARYVASRFHPQRFMGEEGFDRAELRAWAKRNASAVLATPWLRGRSRER